jgi:broad specificity phosphatase PhoE
VSVPALILVRHARPRIEPDLAPPRWPLSDEGRVAAQALALRLAPLRPIVTVASTEPKAIETAQILVRGLGLAVAADPAFDEHRREAWLFEADPSAVTARVRRVLAEPGASIDGAETGEAARARFAAGLAAHAARPLLVASHGTVLSLWLADRLGMGAGELWSSLKTPEAFLFDGQGRLIDRIA